MAIASQLELRLADLGAGSVRLAAKQYALRGWSVIPVPHRSKNPSFKGWERMRLSAETIGDHFNGRPQNIGVLLGEPSGWLIDVDLDHALAIELAPDFLPPTTTIFGRPSKPRSHWLYRVTAPLSTKKFRSTSAGMIVEVRSTRLQTIFPPSAHESGELISWEPNAGEPSRVAPEELLEAAQSLANAVLVELGEKRNDDRPTQLGQRPVARASAGGQLDRAARCLEAMSQMDMVDRRDGSSRLFAAACRSVEFDLTDEEALATIRDFALQRPFSKVWSDAEVLRRVRDAEIKTVRGKALVAVRSRTDMGNAERFAALHGDDIRYIHQWDKWLAWTGCRWQIDDSGEVVRRAKLTAKAIYHEAALVGEAAEAEEICKWARASQSAARIDAMLKLARSERPIPISHDALDAHPWLLNCQNGVIDLTTGELLPHDRSRYLMKSTGVEYPDEPGVDAPLWFEFLDTIFESDAELIAFMQRLMGVAVAGVQQDHLVPIAYGSGANGKGVFTTTIQHALGDYAMTAPPGLLMTKRNEQHPTELADLFGKRLVVISETKDGQRLDEGLVKSVSGGDRIRARRMREDFWEFAPSHLPLVVTNYKPVVRGADFGIWRRLRLIPFTVTIGLERQDHRLGEKLVAELPGILKWMVEGCLAWQRQGLCEPRSVLAATEEYRSESDTFSRWFDEHMAIDPQGQCRANAAYGSYRAWCEDAGEPAVNQSQFGVRMSAKITGKRTSNGTWYEGVSFQGSNTGGDVSAEEN